MESHGGRLAPGIAGGGLVLLVVGFLAVTAGLGLVAFLPDDAETQGVTQDMGANGETERQGRLGQTVAVGGGAVAFLGLIFIVIGRAD